VLSQAHDLKAAGVKVHKVAKDVWRVEYPPS
jgi:hypothetical protein